MKKLNFIFSTLILLVTASIFAQNNNFNYQAVIRDGAGEIMENESVVIKFKILKNSSSGTIVYAETHSTTTNEQGLVNLSIGNGTVTGGNFSTVSWSLFDHYLNINIEGTDMGTSEFKSVPSAQSANSGTNKFRVDSIFVISNSSINEVNHIKTSATGQLQILPNGVGLPSVTFDDDGIKGVGIGTSNPTEKLEVNGAIKVTDQTTNPQPNTIYGNSLPVAYGFIYASGVIGLNYGVASTTKTATGRYTIVLDNPTTSNAYSFIATMFDTNTVGFISYYGVNNTTINVRTTNISGVDTDRAISFIVHGSTL